MKRMNVKKIVDMISWTAVIVSVLSILLFAGSVKASAEESYVDDEIRYTFSEAVMFMDKAASDTPARISLPFAFPDTRKEELAELIQAQDEQFIADMENGLTEALTASIDEYFGAGVYVPAVYPMGLNESRSGNYAMYWYNAADQQIITMQVAPVPQSGEEWFLKWNVELGRTSYEPISLDYMELPFGLEYGAGEEEVRAAIRDLPYSYYLNAEASSAENAVYTVFCPENEEIGYLQLIVEPLDYLQDLSRFVGQPGLRHPYDRKLVRVYYYLHDTAADEIADSLKNVWEDTSILRDGLKETLVADRLSEDIIDVSLLDQSPLAAQWSHLWKTYESLSFNKGQGDPSTMYICYTGRAASVIPVLEAWVSGFGE